MYALCVSGAVNTQGFVWKFFLCAIYKCSFIQMFSTLFPLTFIASVMYFAMLRSWSRSLREGVP